MIQKILTKAANLFRTRICKICDQKAHVYGAVDFSKSCLEKDGIVLPKMGKPVPYWHCKSCGFVFTDYCDMWSKEDFSNHIYNDTYLEVDPEFAGARAARNAKSIVKAFGGRHKGLQILDYGSGDGQLASFVNEQGLSATSYDPYFEHMVRPDNKFDIITSYEVMEHTPTPLATVKDMLSFLKEEGVVLFSTLLMPPSIAHKEKLSWWYIGPRNGHISIYTKDALRILFEKAGFTVRSFNQNEHIAYKTLPRYAQHLLESSSP